MAILLRNSVCLLILLQLLTIDAFTIEKVKQDEEEQNGIISSYTLFDVFQFSSLRVFTNY